MKIKDLQDKLTEYTNPKNLGNEILKSLTKEFYLKDTKTYNKIAHDFYIASLQKDRALSATILCNWMECSDFQDVEGLDCLNSRSGTLTYVCDAYCSSELKYKVLMQWCAEPQYELMHISDLFFGIVQRTKNQTKTTLDSQFNLDDLHKFKLVTELLLMHKECLTNNNLKITRNLNIILRSLDFCEIPATEIVKVLALYQHICKPIIEKVSKLYSKGKFESILSTAQALGVVNNPDYWVQSLTATHQILENTSNLPKFE